MNRHKRILLALGLCLVIGIALACASSTPKSTGPTSVQWNNLMDKSSDTPMDAQWDAYVGSLIGKRAAWTCKVSNATSSGTLRVYCGDSYRGCLIHISVPRDWAPLYNKGDTVTFSGTIRSISRPCNVRFVDVKTAKPR